MAVQVALTELTRSGALDGIVDWPVDRVRSMRDACRDREVRLSYERRLAQGRLDVALAELQRRDQKGTESGNLVESLAVILADRPSGAPRSDRAVGLIHPSDSDEGLEDDHPALLMDLPDLGNAEITALVTSLQERERELSEQRRALLSNLDQLQEELVVRYREGRAQVTQVLDTPSKTD